jgi:hypothetical protein
MLLKIAEGEHVAYCGDGEFDCAVEVGNQGQVIKQASDQASYVRWLEGPATGEITLLANMDLAVLRGTEELPPVEPMQSFAARQVYEAKGASGLINQLNEEGHLSFFSELAADAVNYVAENIKRDPAFRSVLAQLSPTEANELVHLSATVLLRDAFGDG